MRAVISLALSRPTSVSGSCRSQNRALVMPSTPVTPTFDRVLCQPISLSMNARRAAALRQASSLMLALAVVSHAVQSPWIGISSRLEKFSR
ncbi:hypothetical protein D3C86_1955570 [compost metagenome]